MAIIWDPEKRQYVDLNESLASYEPSGPKSLSNPYSDPIAQSNYVEKLKSMSKLQEEPVDSQIQVAPTGSADAAKQAADAQKQKLSETQNQEKAISGGLTTAGMATANPYLTGAGLGLQAISMVNQAKNGRQMNRYNAELQKYQARQQVISRMAQIGQGLKA